VVLHYLIFILCIFFFTNWKLKENFHKVIVGHLHDIFFSSNLNLKYIIALTTVHCNHLLILQPSARYSKYHSHIFFVFCFAIFLFVLLIYLNFVTSMSEILPFLTCGAVSTRCLFDEVSTILQNINVKKTGNLKW
jgi:hypothetical protein